ncbi:class-II fumarase/aspartase family protein [Streptomyces sindenensis]|uniref:class-II fumarase/aspartase family protein n=1 Tax=Streptomyces sindenensis TaxID=67363 RepID=UPI00167393F9|nr:adenylosuccinate lyase family protein [Streptomyces sindenensis]GGP65828.1 putative 3-carboxymuconate cycloisomerase (PcaB) [Streptomyces sindenensis]
MTAAEPGPDAGLLVPVCAGTPVEAAVDDRAWLQAMLDAEAALARAQSTLGTVPPGAAAVITETARAELFDVRALALAARETANPVVPLVRELTRLVALSDPAAAEYVHRGSTSQDVFDTGAMLVSARVARLLLADLRRTADALYELAAAHRDTPMAGRTLALHAVPTTFGLKAAGWRDLVLDAADRVAGVLAGGLPVSLGGAAGTLAGYLEYAAIAAAGGTSAGLDRGGYLDALNGAFAAETGLARQRTPWHSLRTPVADLAAALAFTTGALGKIAVDVQSMVRTEVDEVAEPAVAGRGRSSAMPHKRNPVLATLIRSAALQVPALAAGLTQCMLAEDERSAGVWHAEWPLLRACLRLAGGAAHTAVELAEGLVVRPERMRGNLRLTGSQMASERVAAALASGLGRSRAQELLAEASATARHTGRPLAEVLAALPGVAACLDPRELSVLLDPLGYTGAAGPLVDRALERPAGPA